MDLPHRGKVLLGQRRNAEGNYWGGVHFLERKGKDFVSTGSITLPRFSNPFNFAQCDLSGKGSIFTILLDPWEHLLVNNPAGEQLWKSDDFFGGSLRYMEYMDPNKNDMAQTERKLFIASPIFTYDVNGDGKKEVVVCKNHSN